MISKTGCFCSRFFFGEKMEFVKIEKESGRIGELSAMATEILREYYDPLLGVEQNSYMLEKFQSVKGITGQLEQGYNY